MMKKYLLSLTALLAFAQSANAQPQTATSAAKIVQWTPSIPKPNGPVNLDIEEINVNDANQNNRIDAKEQFTITFNIINRGPGTAYRVTPQLLVSGYEKYITYKIQSVIPILLPNKSEQVTIHGQSSAALPDGDVKMVLNVSDGNNFACSPRQINIQSYAFRPPKVLVKQYIFVSQDGGVPKPNSFITLKMIIKNDGESSAEDVKVAFDLPRNAFNGDPSQQPSRYVGVLLPKEEKLIEFPFFVNGQFDGSTVEIKTKLSESYGLYAVNPEKMPAIDISKAVGKNSSTTILAHNDGVQKPTTTLRLISDVNENIPVTNKKQPNVFALVVGNEGYLARNGEIDVPYANSDASTFADYLVKTLGVPQQNIILRQDATKAIMESEIELLCKRAKSYPDTVNPAQLIFYYAGHGITDALTKESYLVPVDVSAKEVKKGLRTADVYTLFAKADASRATVFLDACFSGSSRTGSILEGRAMRVEPNKDVINGNVVIFAASRNDQIALSYDQQQHGMFTYFLLNKIQSTLGLVSYDELNRFLEQQVNHTSLLVNNIEQIPSVVASPAVGEEWRKWTLTNK